MLVSHCKIYITHWGTDSMVIMYSDDKTWKQHYEDWERIIKKLGDDKGSKYRKDVIQDLINDYNRSQNQDG